MSAKEALCDKELNFAVKVCSEFVKTALVEVSRQSEISLRLRARCRHLATRGDMSSRSR